MPEKTFCDTGVLPELARQLLDFAGPRRQWALYGDIGAGKTTLVQAIGANLGIEEPISSPTYGLVHEYNYSADNGWQPFYHLDLYRLESIEEALAIGIEEYLESGHYCMIEWPELIEPLLAPDALRIRLEILPDSSRKILFL